MKLSTLHFIGTSLAAILFNLLSSLLFIRLLFYFYRPRIEISKTIGKDNRENKEIKDSSSPPYYWFKIISWSGYRAFDIKLKLFVVTSHHAGGLHLNLKPLSILNSFAEPPSLAANTRKDNSNENCLQFRTNEDLENIIEEDDKFIRVVVEARHGLSGLPKVFVQDYDSMSCLKTGRFKSGDTFDHTG